MFFHEFSIIIFSQATLTKILSFLLFFQGDAGPQRTSFKRVEESAKQGSLFQSNPNFPGQTQSCRLGFCGWFSSAKRMEKQNCFLMKCDGFPKCQSNTTDGFSLDFRSPVNIHIPWNNTKHTYWYQQQIPAPYVDLQGLCR